jgi:DNA-binding CsgD family transcriptional regulator
MIVRPLVCPVLVARREELDELTERRRAAARGHGSVVLVAGDAGIGKSRLVAAFRDTLSNGRASIGVGLCREVGNIPYGPLADALGGLDPAFVLPTAPTRAEQLAAMLAALRSVCARRNAVLIFEDLHWADEGTLSFLAHVLPALASMRLLVVATYRSDEVHGGQTVTRYVARLTRDRGNAHVVLGPLQPAETRSLLRHAIAGHATLDGSVIEEIVERSEGNPFFAEELLKSALERRERSSVRSELPLTIRSAVNERLAGLEPGARRLLVLAAVLGRRFEAEFLAEIADRPLSDVLDVLRRVRDLQLVDELRAPAHAIVYAFRHALIRDAIYDEMLALELRPLHARILTALEQQEIAGATDLGYHAWAALDAERCVRYNERAGDEADALHAYADAVRCYERAMDGAREDAVRRRLLEKAARSCARDGKPARAMHLYEAAAEACERSGHGARVVELYQAMSSEARLAGDNERAMAILRRALYVLPAADATARATLSLTLAFLHLDRGETSRAEQLIGEAGAATHTPVYYNTCGYAAMVNGDLEAVRSASTQHLELCAPLDADRVLRARFNLGFSLCVLGVDTEALDLFDAILPELRERRMSSLEVLACANAALIHARAGRLRAGRLMVERGLAIPEPATTGPIALASAALEIGRALSDEMLVARSVSVELIEAAFVSRINTTLGRLAGPYARWLDARGDRRAAAGVLRRAMSALTAPGGATETIVAAVELGDEATRRDALAFVPSIDAMSHLPIYAATALHVRALAASRAGDPAAAHAFATRAETCYRELGWPLHAARCLELAADPASAAATYIAAQSSADLRRLESLRPEPASAPLALSRRELQIAELVASGTPNKRLAERLDVSQRTIEKHLTSIYGKLGLRNRSELAAFVARVPLAGTPMGHDAQS